MNLKTKQHIDRIIGPGLCLLLTAYKNAQSFFNRRRSNLAARPGKILIMKFWGMGSILLASPAVRQLQKSYPESEIIFLTMESNREILSRLEICNHVETINTDRGLITLFIDIFRLIARLKKQKINMVIDLEFFTRFSAVITALIGAPASGGFYDRQVYRGYLHGVRVPFNRYWHTKTNFENLISKCAAIETGANTLLVRPRINSGDRDSLQKLLAENNITGGERIIAVNINAGELAHERRWPAHHFISLIEKLSKNFKGKIILIGHASESAYVGTIHRALPANAALDFSGRLSLGMLAALMERVTLMISNDSGPLHLAAAVGARTISFFGPETPVLYAPVGENHTILYKNIDCSPCINVHTGKIVRCLKTKPECLENITAEEVTQVLGDVLRY